MGQMNVDVIKKWFSEHPEVMDIQVSAVDINGIWRGKRVPAAQLEKIISGGVRMPISGLGLDIWGRDVENSPLVFESGDKDGACLPTGRLVFLPGKNGNASVLMPTTMRLDDDKFSPVDVRAILQNAVERAERMGFRAVMALELEFYLLENKKNPLQAASSPVTDSRNQKDAILDVDELSHFSAFFDEVYSICRNSSVLVDTAISEAGVGQFEVNLMHDEPLKAADDAVLFKTIFKQVAKQNQKQVSFMAKPFIEQAGSGMHVHFSLLDHNGQNVFDNGGPEGSDVLRSAVAGLLETMRASTLIWAPHMNSYRRFAINSHAPNKISWGYENRTVALRIPGGASSARRIEHRISGADANPYLVLASILHGALDGIEGRLSPQAPTQGNAYIQDLDQISDHWIDAIRDFENSDFFKRNFPKMFVDVFALAKRQEYTDVLGHITNAEIDAYLTTV